MDDAAPVSIGEAVQGVDDDIEALREGERVTAPDQFREVGALDELHGDVEVLAGVTEVVDRDDIRVLEGAGGPRLAHEPLAQHGIAGDDCAHDLDGQVAVEDRVVGAIDDAHGTFA